MRYRLAAVAETGPTFSSFQPYVPAVSAGVVAFAAATVAGQAVFLDQGEGPRALGARDLVAAVVSHPDLNASGDLSFFARSSSGEEGLARVREDRLDWVALPEGIGPLGPTMNDAGVVALRAPADGQAAVWRHSADGLDLVARADMRPFAAFHGLPVVDHLGRTVFRADLADGRQGVFRADGGGIETIYETTSPRERVGLFPFAGEGGVAFVGADDDGSPWIWVARSDSLGGRTMHGAGAFESLRGALLDARGYLVFYATPSGGQLGVYAGPDPQRDRILGVGDPWAGSTVAEFALNPVSIDAEGRLALRVLLADGREAVLRGDPG